MSDPIVKILAEMPYDEFINARYEPTAKQIRQQIGRELLDPNIRTYGYTAEMAARIREVCQLEEDNE